MNDGPGQLNLVAGPIGHLGDLSDRARAALEAADAVVVEDSRVSGRLLAHLGLKRRMVVVNEHSRPEAVARLADEIAAGGNWALLTDAGTPGISDPGAQLVDEVYARGGLVDAIPGPSAVTTALALSGFFAQRFAFLGFLPRKPGPAKSVLEPFVDSTLTLVLFESPHRYRAVLSLLADTLGSRRYAVCRELTKLHQQVYRGEFPVLPTPAEVPDKGEFTLVIEGRRREPTDRLGNI